MSTYVDQAEDRSNKLSGSALTQAWLAYPEPRDDREIRLAWTHLGGTALA